MRLIWIPLFCLTLCAGARAEQAITAEDFLPEETIAAVIVPDLATARAAAKKTKLAEMFAQPEIQEFIKPIQAELEKQYEAVRAANPLIPAAADIDNSILSGELAAAVVAMPTNKRKQECIVATFRPKDAEAFKRLLPGQLAQVVFSGQPIPLKQAGVIQWVKDRLVFCNNAEDAPAVLARATALNEKSVGKLPAYIAAKAKLSSPAGLVYFSPARLAKFALGIAADADVPDLEKVRAAIKSLALEQCPASIASVGFNGGVPVLETIVSLDSPAAGLWSLWIPPVDAAPLKADLFKIAGPDAPFAAGGYFNIAGVLPLIRKTAEAADPATAGLVDIQLKQAGDTLGFDIQEDLLANLGPDFVVAQTTIDTSLPLSFLPGMVYSIAARNPQKVQECIEKIGKALGQVALPIEGQHFWKKVSYKERNIYYIASLVAPVPAFICVNGDRLLVGTSLNAMYRTLDQLSSADSILTNKAFQDSITRVTGKAALPSGFAYSRDEGSGIGSLVMCATYYAVAGGATTALAAIPSPKGPPPQSNDPMDKPAVKTGMALLQAVDLALWPDESFFRKHRFSTAGFATVDAAGLFTRTELPFPGPSGSSSGSTLMIGTGVVAIVAAIAVPSLLRSRMAANQTAAAANCRAYAEAQEIYRRTDYDNDGVLEYSQSLKGDHSLLETKAGAGDLALVDKTLAGAEGNPSQHPTPKAGYCFKILKGQGEHATGGKRSYLAGENMTLGYAIIAYPSAYDGTGRDCFVISNNGTTFQKDLGADTHKIVEAMTEFDPDETWAATE